MESWSRSTSSPSSSGRHNERGGIDTERVLVGGQVLTDRGFEDAAVFVDGPRIRAIARVDGPGALSGRDVIDCSGLAVVPGFIDAHAHDDVAVTRPEWAAAKIRQGITTTTVGMDGLGYAPVAPDVGEALVRYWRPVNGDPERRLYPTIADQRRGYEGTLALNVILHAPHANFRLAETGFRRAALNADQMGRAIRAVEEALADGALGLTTGLSYVPAVFSSFDELALLARPLVARHLPYITHLRSYGLEIWGAVEEAIRLGCELGIPIHLSHLHLCHPSLFGQAVTLLERLERAREAGVDLSWDLYPYTAGSSILHAYLPVWMTEDGPEALERRLNCPDTTERLDGDRAFQAFDWNAVTIAGTRTGAGVGKTVAEVARDTGRSIGGAVVWMLREERLEVSCVVQQTWEEDDDLLLAAGPAVVGSDGLMFGQRPHPRGYGAFAAFFARFVRSQGRIGLEAAVRKMSTQTARLYGLRDRGRIAPGLIADLTVFDPVSYDARATYDQPRLPATGVRHVLVNGRPVLRDGILQPIRPGEVVSR